MPSVKATGTTYSISDEIVKGSDINTGDDNFALGDDAKVRHYTLSADCAYAAPKVLGTTSVPTVKFTSGSLVKSAQVSTDSKVTITGIDPNSNAENLLVANATYPKRNAVYNRGNVWKLNTAANKLYPPAVDGNLAARIYQEENENGQLINSFVAEVRLAEPKFTHSAMSVCGVNLPENHKTDADYMILHVNGEESLKHHGQINSDSHLLYREEIGGWWNGLIELYTEKVKAMNFTFGGAHVYIFNIGAPTMTLAAAPAAAPARVMARAATDGATHSVVATEKEIRTFSGQDIPTGVNGVMTDGNVSVTAGEGVINVAANTANVYNVAGALVATGAGSHNVAAGVYVVRADGKTFKVVVR